MEKLKKVKWEQFNDVVTSSNVTFSVVAKEAVNTSALLNVRIDCDVEAPN